MGHGSLLLEDEARTCRLGFVMIDPGRRGEGLGRKLMGLLTAKAFGTKHATELTRTSKQRLSHAEVITPLEVR